MADISFLLLIFFLVATTMNVDTGLMRVLPPMPPEDQKVEDQKVKERNLLLVFVSASGNIMAGDENMDIHGIKDKAKDFILNTYDDENLPEKEDQEFELPDGSKWVYPESQGVVSLQTTRAFNEIRDEVAMEKFGAKLVDLPEEERNVITKAIPLAISEAEPRKAIKK